MKTVLATGIYPPEIGGPATYAHSLAQEFAGRGIDIHVVTYAHRKSQIPNSKFQTNPKSQVPNPKATWEVVRVSKSGGPVCRWRRYAKVLTRHASDADAVIAFSSVSCGVPLWMAGLKKPKKILRLGGDFFWERYTDHGGRRTLREFYEHTPIIYSFIRLFVQRLLQTFDYIVFSTRFQEELYERYYRNLPPHSVIENALETKNYQLKTHRRHDPFRLLWMGRFVGFKNLTSLIAAMSDVRLAMSCELTLVGDGPLLPKLTAHSSQLNVPVSFLPPVHDDEKQRIFTEHDLLVLPSLTEISPNVALEARASGLPVLLTEETGLSEELRQGMVVRDLSTPDGITMAIRGVTDHYEDIASSAATPASRRLWGDVAEEWLKLISGLP